MRMLRLRPIRRKAVIPPRALRGVEAAFWFMLALAFALGGKSALGGLPRLGEMLLPKQMFAAEARGDAVTQVTRLNLPATAASLFKPQVLYPVVEHPFPEWMVNRGPAIAIVIDDLGADAAAARRAMALPQAVALSFLPYPEATPVLARAAARSGHDVLVHLPMQAEDGAIDPGPMTLRLDLPADENLRRLDWALSRVPGFVGINNHEGSAFTQDRAALVPVAEALADRHVFFFDSRTTAESQVVPVARAFGVPSASRDVFLDDVQTPEAIEAQLAELARLARQNGIAIAIGHPHAVTLDVLARWCAAPSGVRLVRISQAIKMKTEREMGVSLAALGR
jgi:uncharacterized protein